MLDFNLVPRVLSLFGQRLVERRDSGVLEFYYRRISAVKQWKPLRSWNRAANQKINFFRILQSLSWRLLADQKAWRLWVRDWLDFRRDSSIQQTFPLDFTSVKAKKNDGFQQQTVDNHFLEIGKFRHQSFCERLHENVWSSTRITDNVHAHVLIENCWRGHSLFSFYMKPLQTVLQSNL